MDRPLLRSGIVRGWVLIEVHDTIENAILREKRLKNWNRLWKCRLIVEQNPNWDDLWVQLNGGAVAGVAPDNAAASIGLNVPRTFKGRPGDDPTQCSSAGATNMARTRSE